MSEREGYQPGVPCWVASVQPDAERAARFYVDLFGWKVANLMPAEAPAKYFLCRLRGRDVAAVVSQHGAPPPPAPVWSTHIWVDDADEGAARVVEMGGCVLGEAFDSPGGGRMAVVADPAGAVFCLWQPTERRGAQVINEPGAWAMSHLNARDLDGAKRFYGAVFGWETDTFEIGDGEITLWRVPGYRGGEPEQPVSRDVVATMLPISDERFGDDGRPHWSVEFWVDDADAVAARAAELGGGVEVAPYDVPGFRQAVLTDPQGAVFVVSTRRLPG